MKTMILAAICGTASIASAGVITSVTNPGVATDVFGVSAQSNGGDRALGDTVNWAVTGFGDGGGAFLNGPNTHTVGGTDFGAGLAGISADLNITSSVSDAGGIRTIDITISSVSGGAVAVAGLAVGGLPVTSVFFEVPGTNAGIDLFDDAQKAGAAAGTFNLLGTGGATIFSTAAGVTDSGTSFALNNGVNAGGVDIFDPALVGDIISGANWTISYAIPAPGAGVMLGLAGLAATRRRR